MKRADIVIIGGGVIGLALAWRLAQTGAAPLVVDAGLLSATEAAAGMLTPSFEHAPPPLAETLYRFSACSLAAWRDFAAELQEESGVAIDYQPCGVLGVAFRPSEEAALHADVASLDARGAKVEWLGAADVRALEPALAPAVRGGLFAPNDGQVDPRLATTALRRAVERRGGQVVAGRVRAIAADGDGARVELAEGDAIAARVVAVAAGAMVTALPLPTSPPVYPVKGEAVALSARDSPIRRVVRAPGAYLCPKADGRLVVGATEIPHDTTPEPGEAAIARLRAAASRAAPVLERFEEHSRWAGLRPATPDGAPILGVSARGPSWLVHALGHYRNGVLHAPATADLLARLILNGTGAAELEAFSPDRFASARESAGQGVNH